MKYFVYQFEAVFIQEYVLAGGKIKTMVGASEIIEAITNQLLDTAIEKLGLQQKEPERFEGKGELSLADNEVVFPRRAGAVFMMISQNEQKAQAFSQLWPILVSNFAPGLRFSAALDSDEKLSEAARKVRNKLNDQKNQPQTFLPESTPLTVRFQKTGLAQVSSPKSARDGADWTMLAKLKNEYQTLAAKHLDEKHKVNKDQYFFPKLFEHKHTNEYWKESFPFKSINPGNHSIAIIHTDGNGLGLYVQKIFNELEGLSATEYVRTYAAFSQDLDEATQKAAREATSWLAEKYSDEKNPYKDKLTSDQVTPLPMRPLILGGDDLTCIVRADYAIGFIQAFTQAFEKHTEAFVKNLTTLEKVLPNKLTCTTGMIFIKSNQPFSLAYKLAEELCGEAKKVGQEIAEKQNTSKPMPPSLINFLHTTNTLFDELEVQLKQELKTPDEKTLSRCPYAFKPDQECPDLNRLFKLKAYFNADKDDQLNPSAIRNYAGHLHQDPGYAEVFWKRWEKQVSDKNAKTNQAWSGFHDTWESLCKLDESLKTLPVADLVTLFALDIHNPGQQKNKEANT